jgi:hypothetical protein
MPRKGQSEEKIVFALRQVESGKKAADVCRGMGVPDATTIEAVHGQYMIPSKMPIRL